jgi:hypothetical protein
LAFAGEEQGPKSPLSRRHSKLAAGSSELKVNFALRFASLRFGPLPLSVSGGWFAAGS